MQRQKSLELNHGQALRIEGAAAVEVAVPLRTGEGRHHPRIGIGGHDVGVVQQHERRLIAAGKARHDAPPPRGGLEGFVGDALGVEDLRKEGNSAAFVPRRIDGVDAQIVRQPRERGLGVRPRGSEGPGTGGPQPGQGAEQ